MSLVTMLRREGTPGRQPVAGPDSLGLRRLGENRLRRRARSRSFWGKRERERERERERVKERGRGKST